jgi:Tetratricopeptide repeat
LQLSVTRRVLNVTVLAALAGLIGAAMTVPVAAQQTPPVLDIHGRVDHARLGASLYQVGYCLLDTGEFAAAKPWFVRAVAEAEKGDVHGRVDHEIVGLGLHQVGSCLLRTGEFAAAKPWFERAVTAKEKGDIHGRVDHASVGTSLDQVGWCLASTGEFAVARPWYKRAVIETEKGWSDSKGRLGHGLRFWNIRAR